jgi:hypothetical protein
MKVTPKIPPRLFEVGRGKTITIQDAGSISLQPDEQVTFVTESGAQYDIVRKSWGFYATPSLNGRLESFGLRAVLVKSPSGKYYVFLVERDRERDFQAYLQVEAHTIVCWLDSHENCRIAEERLRDALGPKQ